MALDTAPAIAAYDAPVKELYELGEMPPLGHVPKQMYAWAIRRDRHGPPEQAMQVEVVDTWQLDSQDVLVLVMASDFAITVTSTGGGITMANPAARSSSTVTRTTATTRSATAATRCSRPASGSGGMRRRTDRSRSSPGCKASS